MNHTRFVVGIDLGTTNSALAFVDTAISPENPDEAFVTTFPIEQIVAAGAVDQRPTLPSVVFKSSGSEVAADALNLPWRHESKTVVGSFARELGTRFPNRLIHSSKSWLCHGGVNREAPILPPGSKERDAKVSPAQVATMVLRHLAEAWDHQFATEDPAARLAQQEVILCVPASFDPAARNLTVKAAQEAGFTNFRLLEEPQAAFHSWIEAQGPNWRDQVRVGDLVVVVDVGGGTTDFSLIAVTEKDGELELNRIAVGDHILLGGDNMDLALAYMVAQTLEAERGTKLDPWQMVSLVQQCRRAKEELLLNPDLPSASITLLGKGSSVIGGTIRTELPRRGLDEFLVEGFFPRCALTDRPAAARRSGFREAGLPYASDPAITRHLAEFLHRHQSAIAEALGTDNPAKLLPSAVLFNGGVFHAGMLRERILNLLGEWAKGAGGDAPRELGQPELDLAVARGAAYYGLACRGRGVRVRSGSPRSYYIGIETAAPAVPGMPAPLKAFCVVPHGLEEGSRLDLSGEQIDLCVWTGEPAAFRFLSSTNRREDKPGDVLDVDDDFVEHPPIETTLRKHDAQGAGEPAEVDLRAELTEVGVLNLSCIDRKTGEIFLLEFNIRSGAEEEAAP